MIMIALAYGNQMDPYDMQNTENEYEYKKSGNGLFVFMMTELGLDSEIDCEILLVSPALQFSWPDFSGKGVSGNLANLQGGSSFSR